MVAREAAEAAVVVTEAALVAAEAAAAAMVEAAEVVDVTVAGVVVHKAGDEASCYGWITPRDSTRASTIVNRRFGDREPPRWTPDNPVDALLDYREHLLVVALCLVYKLVTHLPRRLHALDRPDTAFTATAVDDTDMVHALQREVAHPPRPRRPCPSVAGHHHLRRREGRV